MDAESSPSPAASPFVVPVATVSSKKARPAIYDEVDAPVPPGKTVGSKVVVARPIVSTADAKSKHVHRFRVVVLHGSRVFCRQRVFFVRTLSSSLLLSSLVVYYIRRCHYLTLTVVMA